jgi:hypothetical protein
MRLRAMKATVQGNEQGQPETACKIKFCNPRSSRANEGLSPRFETDSNKSNLQIVAGRQRILLHIVSDPEFS